MRRHHAYATDERKALAIAEKQSRTGKMIISCSQKKNGRPDDLPLLPES
jgi:hypothetical protein